MDIQSKILNDAHRKMEEGTFSQKDLSSLEMINVDDFVELIDLTNKYNRFNYILRGYLTVYNPETVNIAENIISKDTINATISKNWNEEAKPEELNEVFLAFKLFQTNLSERIIEGYADDRDKIELFNKQIIDYILYLGDKIKNKKFYNTVTNNHLKEDDKTVNLTQNKEIEHFKELYKIVENSLKIIDFNNKKKNLSDNSALASKYFDYYRTQFREWEKSTFEKLHFLPEYLLEGLYTRPKDINEEKTEVIDTTNINNEKTIHKPETKEDTLSYDDYKPEERQTKKITNDFFKKCTFFISKAISNKNTQDNDNLELLIRDGDNQTITKNNGFFIGFVLLFIIGSGVFLIFKDASSEKQKNSNVEKVLNESKEKMVNKFNLPNEIDKKIVYVE